MTTVFALILVADHAIMTALLEVSAIVQHICHAGESVVFPKGPIWAARGPYFGNPIAQIQANAALRAPCPLLLQACGQAALDVCDRTHRPTGKHPGLKLVDRTRHARFAVHTSGAKNPHRKPVDRGGYGTSH